MLHAKLVASTYSIFRRENILITFQNAVQSHYNSMFWDHLDGPWYK